MPEPEFRRIDRTYKGTKTPEQLEIEPEKFQGCPYWSWYKEIHTEQRHRRACKKCWGCRNFKHERIVGQAMAQAQTAVCIMSFTLTYRPELGITRLDYSHVVKFLKRLRRAGFRFVKICCGEYGGKNGAPHWHLLLMFEGDEGTKQKILTAISQGEDYQHIGRGQEWKHLVPKHTANLRGKAFQDAINDPDQLVVTFPQRGKTARARNTKWKYWEYGIVEAQIVKSPEVGAPEQIEGAVRYPLKYLSKDAWKDSRKYKDIPFEELPEHIRQQTRFGPWYTDEEVERQYNADVASGVVKSEGWQFRKNKQEHRKWRYGNDYVKGLKAQLLKDFNSDDEIPPERQIMQGIYQYKAVGGLGADYFKALGAFHAQNPQYALNDENLRQYELGGNFRRNQPSLGRKIEVDAVGEVRYARDNRGKITIHPRRRYKYSMGDTSYRMFWEGYNDQLVKMGKDPSHGPDDVVTQLDTSRMCANDASTGSFGNYYWKKSSVSARRVIEENTAQLPDEKLRGFWPTRWRRQMEQTSCHWEWRKKGLDRQLALVKSNAKKNDGRAHPSLTVPLLDQVRSVRVALVKNQLRVDGKVAQPFDVQRIKGLLAGYVDGLNPLDRAVYASSPDPMLGAESWQTSDERRHSAKLARRSRKPLVERWVDSSEPEPDVIEPHGQTDVSPAVHNSPSLVDAQSVPNYRTAKRVDDDGPQYRKAEPTAAPPPVGATPKTRPSRGKTLWRYGQQLKASGGLEANRKL